MKPKTSYRWFDYRARRGNGILIEVPGANFDDPNEFEPIAADIYAAFGNSDIWKAEVWIVGPSVNPHRLGVLINEAGSSVVFEKVEEICNKFYPDVDITYTTEFGPEKVAEERRKIEEAGGVKNV